MWLVARKVTSGVPGRLQAAVEFLVEMVEDQAKKDELWNSWVEAWLRTTGFDTVRVVRDGSGASLVREGSRPHRLTVSAYDDTMRLVDSRDVHLGDEPVLGVGARPDPGGDAQQEHEPEQPPQPRHAGFSFDVDVGHVAQRAAWVDRDLCEQFAVALADWPRSGVPDQPEAWLLTVARNVIGNEYFSAPVWASTPFSMLSGVSSRCDANRAPTREGCAALRAS